jgi:citrate lyase beta subunit
MRSRRALLFMPGDDRHKIEKGAGLDVDSIIMDLEDGVAAANKPVARHVVAVALYEVQFGRSERLVRINPFSTPLWEEDIDETIAARPDGYVLPKVHSAREVQFISSKIEAAERHHDWPLGSIRLLAIIESARGVVNLREIAESDPRLDALIFGAEDLAGDIGAKRSREGWEGFYARSAVVVHAKAFALQAIDTVFVDLNDIDGLRADAQNGVDMGFTGKLAIHPRQVEPIQTAFTPSQEAVDHARRLIETYRRFEEQGKGAFEMDGKMVDMPMVRAAEGILDRARAAGLDV